MGALNIEQIRRNMKYHKYMASYHWFWFDFKGHPEELSTPGFRPDFKPHEHIEEMQKHLRFETECRNILKAEVGRFNCSPNRGTVGNS